MTTNGIQRKLKAILSADVKGYSTLMGDDDEFTVTTITRYRQIISTLIQKHQGRVVDSPGDNMLADFASALDAVNAAIEIQRRLAVENAQMSGERRMEFRIGINLGDVLQKDDRIYGNGVNIAARIEGLAASGGICISRGVYDQVKKKVAEGFEYLGAHDVKNIDEPVRIYRILLSPGHESKITDTVALPKTSRRRIYIAIGVALGVISAALIWFFYPPSPPADPDASPHLAMSRPEKPSIAVLPFKNIDGDQAQAYFSDGITNDIITDLSKFSELFVIASNSVFVYKGKPVKAQQIQQELGVRYILEGSVQRASGKVRVNAQLIDAGTGHHLWAERYDRNLQDLFAVQDDIVQTIVATLAVKIDAEERARVMRKDTKNLEAYDYVLRGWEYFWRSTRAANNQARRMFEKAIELDAHYATAYVGLGQTYMTHFAYGWTEFSEQALQAAHDLAQKALSLDETSAPAHALLGEVYRYRMQYDLALKEYERAIVLNPNDANSHAERGAIMNYRGETDEAIDALETTLRFNPHMRPSNYMQLGLAYYLKGRYEDAIEILERGLSWYPDDVFIHIPLAAAYAQAGQPQNAARITAKIRRLHPFFEIDHYGTAFIRPADRSRIADGLRAAGL